MATRCAVYDALQTWIHAAPFVPPNALSCESISHDEILIDYCTSILYLQVCNPFVLLAPVMHRPLRDPISVAIRATSAKAVAQPASFLEVARASAEYLRLASSWHQEV